MTGSGGPVLDKEAMMACPRGWLLGVLAVGPALGGCPQYNFPEHQVLGRTAIVALVGPQAPVAASQSIPLVVWYYDPDGPATGMAIASISNTTEVPIQGNAVEARLDDAPRQASAPVATLVERDLHTYRISPVRVKDYVTDGGHAFHQLVVPFVSEATGTITVEAAATPGFAWTDALRQTFASQSGMPATAATTRLQFEVR